MAVVVGMTGFGPNYESTGPGWWWYCCAAVAAVGAGGAVGGAGGGGRLYTSDAADE